jgi:outer membrane protein assembly factor BamB
MATESSAERSPVGGANSPNPATARQFGRQWLAMVAAIVLALITAWWSIGRETLRFPHRDTRLTAEHEPLAAAPNESGSAASEVANDDWPNLFGPRHDNSAAMVSQRVRPWGDQPPPERWRAVCGAGYSSPIVAKNRLVLLHRIGDEELVTCRDAATGEVQWERQYPTSFVCGSHYTSGPYSTPASDGDAVYTLGAQGELHCWSVADGQLRWSRSLSEEFQVPAGIFGAGHSPLLWGDRLVVNVGGSTENAGVVAFQKQTGEILWQSTSIGAAFATPRIARIHGRDWLFVLGLKGLVLLDPRSGTEHWQIPFEPKIPDSANAVTPFVSGDNVVVSAWGVGTKALMIAPDGVYSVLWDSKRTLTSQYTPLLEVGDCLVGVHALDNSLRGVDLHTGELRWRWKSELANCKPIQIGDQLVLFGEYGHLGLARCTAEGAVAECMTSEGLFGGRERCFSAPAFAHGRLYLRSEAELVCFDLTADSGSMVSSPPVDADAR